MVPKGDDSLGLFMLKLKKIFRRNKKCQTVRIIKK